MTRLPGWTDPTFFVLAALLTAGPAAAQSWPVHSLDRPRPPQVNPGPEQPPLPPPSDAIVLFAGNDLHDWESTDSVSGPAAWKVENGYMEVVKGAGAIETRRRFGSIQLHVEWSTPTPPEGTGQDRGNSGVFLMGQYEIQVLDSWQNITYADGQAAAMYGQVPPLVNVSRPPGQWQTYDIVFHRPRFRADGSVERPATVTVFHNGVLVHDHDAFRGQTVHGREATYQPHPDTGPLLLQDHGHPVRYRNIWARELAD
jgi:3-keto-disaccharide hydrolase